MEPLFYICGRHMNCLRFPIRYFSSGLQACPETDNLRASTFAKKAKNVYGYEQLFPWENLTQFSSHLTSSVVYNKDGLIVLNKPFGVAIYGLHNEDRKPRSKIQSATLKIKEFPFSIEDALPYLESNLNLSNLRILKSAERYSSGIVMMCTRKTIAGKVKNSVQIAKHKQIPHLTHWMLTIGYPAIPFRKERVGLKFIEVGDNKEKQPVIVTDFSNRSCKLRQVAPVQVEYRVMAVNKKIPSSLIEISTSSVNHYFLRVYASSRAASILGDPMYGSRRSTVLGLPVNLNPQSAQLANEQYVPDQLCSSLNLQRGSTDIKMVPTMLHFQSVVLPSFNGKDLKITAEPPSHFCSTCVKLNLS